MLIINIILIVYGILLFVGGFIGMKAGSKVSLYMGMISCLLVVLGVDRTSSDPKLGYTVVASISGILVIVFLIRLIKARKFMPSGLLILLSIGAAVISILQLF